MNKKACIIGTLNMELILGNVTKIPSWGTQSLVKNLNLSAAGSAIRVALPLSKLGQKSYILGNVGKDIYGQEVIKVVRSYDLSIEGIEEINHQQTGICVSLVKDDGQRIFLSYLGSLSSFNKDNIIRHYQLIQKADYLLLTGYFVLPGLQAESLKNIFKKAKQNGKTVLLDIGWDHRGWSKQTKKEIFSLLKYVDVFLPNYDEAKMLTGCSSPNEMAKELLSYGPAQVIIKLGDKGSLAMNEKGIYEALPFKTKVLDTTAAGESFNAGVLYGLMNKWETEKILKFSNALCSIVISNIDKCYPTLEEVQKKLKRKERENG